MLKLHPDESEGRMGVILFCIGMRMPSRLMGSIYVWKDP